MASSNPPMQTFEVSSMVVRREGVERVPVLVRRVHDGYKEMFKLCVSGDKDWEIRLDGDAGDGETTTVFLIWRDGALHIGIPERED